MDLEETLKPLNLRMLSVSWVDQVKNTEIVRQMGKGCVVVLTVKRRKLEYFVHVMRGVKYLPTKQE